MNFEIQWFQLSLQRANNVLLVLDSARPVKGQDEVEFLATSLLEKLPRSVDVQIAFLGRSQIYSRIQAKSEWQTLWRQSQGYLRTLAPVLQALRDQKLMPQIVVLGNGSIHDVADFQADPLLHRARFIRCRESALTNSLWPEEKPRLESLAIQVDNPVARIEVACEAHLPLFWPADFEWEGGHLTSKSLSQEEEQIIFSFLGPSNQLPTAKMTQRDGTTKLHALTPCAKPEESSWQVFSPQEIQIVQQCIERRSYCCHLCDDIHSANQLKCDSGRNLGTPVLSSVPTQSRLIMVRPNRSGFEWRSVDMQGYPASDGAFIAIGKAQGFYRFEAGSWRQLGTDKPVFQSLSGNGGWLVRI